MSIDQAKRSTPAPEVWAMILLMSWMIEYWAGNEAGVANEAKEEGVTVERREMV